MAATVAFDAGPDGRYVASNKFVRKGTINLGIYATGGVAVTKANFDLAVSLDDLDIRPTGGYVFEWDKTNGKIKAYRQAGITENVNATYLQNQVIAAVPMVEVANAVDITAVVARYRAEGN